MLKIKIGHTFTPNRGKHIRADIYTVVDILTTTNSKGDVVKVSFLCETIVLGSPIKCEFPQSTIIRASFSK